ATRSVSPYTTLFRSAEAQLVADVGVAHAADEALADDHFRPAGLEHAPFDDADAVAYGRGFGADAAHGHVRLAAVHARLGDDDVRSEEHTSELQSREN